MKVRIGFAPGLHGQRDAATFAAVVDALETCGFDSIWLSERVTSALIDPMIGLAFAAARTNRLKLGTSVQVLSGRNPALLAKAWASLDRMSNGRALPAFGLGNVLAGEQQAFGIARGERAAWLEEALPLLRRFWTEDAVDHDGPRFHYEGLSVQPKPAQPRIDVWLGGRAPAELRRCGRLADGWLPSFSTPDECATGREIVDEAAASAGRTIDAEHYGALITYTRASRIPDEQATRIATMRPGMEPTSLVAVGLDALRDRIGAFVAAGFSKLVLAPGAEPVSWADELETVAAAVLDLQK